MSATFCRCIHVNGTPTDAPPTPDTMPPPGPERDRLVAEALGCTTWERNPPHDVALRSSTSTHAAYDVLEAWKRGGNRVVIIKLLGTLPTWAAPHPTSDMVQVSLYDVDRWAPTCDARVIAPTLGDAASRAIIEATRREG